MSASKASKGTNLPAVPEPQDLQWRGDEHKLRVDAAAEAGLDRAETQADLFTQGFSAGIVLDDGFDGAIVARGRTVLKTKELTRTLRPVLHYLGVTLSQFKVKVTQGDFELRISKMAADQSKPALDSGKEALRVWVGFGILGVASYIFLPPVVSSICWGVGLLLGGWQLRRGLASGRSMLGARLAMALGVLAQDEQLILPPAGDKP